MILQKVTTCHECPHSVSQAKGILCLGHWKRVPKRVKTIPKWCKAQEWEGSLTVDEAFAKREKEIAERKASIHKESIEAKKMEDSK